MLALQRINLPQQFIDFYINGFLNKRTTRVITPYGLTSPISVLSGIPQGGVESPLLWLLFYDPLLCRLKCETAGVTVATPIHHNPSDAPTIAAYTIHATSYVDDLAYFAPTAFDLQKGLDIIKSFNDTFHITSNPEKSHLVILNSVDPPGSL